MKELLEEVSLLLEEIMVLCGYIGAIYYLWQGEWLIGAGFWFASTILKRILRLRGK